MWNPEYSIYSNWGSNKSNKERECNKTGIKINRNRCFLLSRNIRFRKCNSVNKLISTKYRNTWLVNT